MFLKSLVEQYDKLLDNNVDIPIYGTSDEYISFCVVIDKTGKIIDIEDLRINDGKKNKPSVIRATSSVVRTSGVKSNFLWDKSSYVFGVDEKGIREKQFNDFKDTILTICENYNTEEIEAIKQYVKNWDIHNAINILSDFKYDLETDFFKSNFVFRLNTANTYMHDDTILVDKWIKYKNKDKVKGLCTITGEDTLLCDIHSKIKKVHGSASSGATLISFNSKVFKSYGQEHASIGDINMFKYTTVLNYLLSNNINNIIIDDITYVFWSSNTIYDNSLSFLFDKPISQNDDGVYNNELFKYFSNIKYGKFVNDITKIIPADVKFYILGLAGANGRISVKFWYENTMLQLVENINQYYNDLYIHSEYDNIMSLKYLLTYKVGKDYELLVNDIVNVMTKVILFNHKIPISLLLNIINRICINGKVSYKYASLIKLILIRNYKMEAKMSLDNESIEIGYLLGRLFAILEITQKQAINNIKKDLAVSNIRMAVCGPTYKVFTQLLLNSKYHIAKIKNNFKMKGYGHYYESIIDSIVGNIGEFPKKLNLKEQSTFMLGYYHQNNETYNKNTQSDKGENND